MFWKISLLLLGLGIALEIETDDKIERLKQQTEVLHRQNPSNGPLCFETYLPILNQIGYQYEIDYELCLNTSDIDANWTEEREQLEQTEESACRALEDCRKIIRYADAFECFAQQAAAISKTMYSISADATEFATKILLEYKMDQTNRTTCINKAERNYVEETADTYTQLNDCLNGHGLTDSYATTTYISVTAPHNSVPTTTTILPTAPHFPTTEGLFTVPEIGTTYNPLTAPHISTYSPPRASGSDPTTASETTNYYPPTPPAIPDPATASKTTTYNPPTAPAIPNPATASKTTTYNPPTAPAIPDPTTAFETTTYSPPRFPAIPDEPQTASETTTYYPPTAPVIPTASETTTYNPPTPPAIPDPTTAFETTTYSPPRFPAIPDEPQTTSETTTYYPPRVPAIPDPPTASKTTTYRSAIPDPPTAPAFPDDSFLDE